MKSERASFGSKLGIILATAGSAVGLGNVWRFPYMAGEHGGGVYIIVYIACVLLLGIPCIVSEFVIGRVPHPTRRGPTAFCPGESRGCLSACSECLQVF